MFEAFASNPYLNLCLYEITVKQLVAAKRESKECLSSVKQLTASED